MRKLTLTSALLAGTAMAAPAFADGHLLIVDEPLELTIQMNHVRYPTYIEDWPVEVAARAMTNIHLVDDTVGANMRTDENTGKTEALNLMLAGGVIPDIVGSSRIKDFVNQYGPEGAFVPLNDLIAEHAPNLQAFFDERPEIASAISAADGNMYYIPYLPDGKYGRAYFIRTDWLEQLGLERPENVEELEAVLVAFRDGDPNGNGLADEVPYFARQWPELIRLVTLWDGRSSGSDTYHDFYVEGDQLVHPYAQEGYREGIANLSRWYAEGLIDAEVFTRGGSSRDYLLGENLGGMTHDWFASTGGYNRLSADIEGFAFEALAPPASVSGVRMEEHRRIPIKPDGWAIGATNEHQIETIKYFDFWFTEEGRRLANFGVEGQQYTMVDGEATFTEEFLTNGEPVNNQLYRVGSQLQARGYYQDYGYEAQWSNEFALEGIALYDEGDYLVDQFLGVAFNADEQRVYDRTFSSIRDYMLERQQGWILGNSDVNEDWDAYIATLNDMGYQELLEVMNSAYARQYGE
ncbi:carbohydrate ABC transporter substrate-binding protein, CUT1 family [Octadecabacter temperatus]|uniref:Lipoprotein LipO n=1 Tax=Octadecabacter temperatus TaxID=1458307 RepID=A0A0K0Y6R4_9RHOB|nr:sugar ABC transporter permease [Octadecabacter temperatus]AKS46659.1 Lipoprotein LipO precursor [Octadecabacter temperatus]SIO18757.1 carbohydrate ABC transporter substrate-binding protein, CUT1 family [Octadecabacter temperatus]